jgi:hypothetical protein
VLEFHRHVSCDPARTFDPVTNGRSIWWPDGRSPLVDSPASAATASECLRGRHVRRRRSSPASRGRHRGDLPLGAGVLDRRRHDLGITGPWSRP